MIIKTQYYLLQKDISSYKVLEISHPRFSSRRKCIPPAVYPAYKKSFPRLSRLVVPVDENFYFMLPITICCDSCSTYIHQGT